MAHTVSSTHNEERKKLDIRSGDTVRVEQRVEESGGKTRLQAFEGLVIATKHGTEPGATFTVRKVIDSVGVEKIFPRYSPTIESVEIVRRAKVRRAKLYHIRDKAKREIRRQMRNVRSVNAMQVPEKTELETSGEQK